MSLRFQEGVCAVSQDGGFEYKKAIVDSILILIREIPAAKEAGLSHLCEFIEVGNQWQICQGHANVCACMLRFSLAEQIAWSATSLEHSTLLYLRAPRLVAASGLIIQGKQSM